MKRHILAFPVPQQTADELNQLYFSVTNQNIPVHFLHTSLITPFKLSSSIKLEPFLHTVRTIKFEPFQAETRAFDLFKQKNQILHLTLAPKQNFQDVHKMVEDRLDSHLDLDTTIFKNGKLPSYKPHITLDYDWQLDPNHVERLNELKINLKFPIDTIHMYSEKKNWLWEQVG